MAYTIDSIFSLANSLDAIIESDFNGHHFTFVSNLIDDRGNLSYSCLSSTKNGRLTSINRLPHNHT